MPRIIFIVSTPKIHYYLWQCITKINESMANVIIDIHIDSTMQPHGMASYPFLRFIDSKFAHYKMNPFTKVDLSSETLKFENITLKNDTETFVTCDWLITENSAHNAPTYLKYAMNGVLTLNIITKKLIHEIANSSYIILDIIALTPTNSWKSVNHVHLKREYGLASNFYKIFFNYAIFLAKFIKNHKEIDLGNQTDLGTVTYKSKYFNLIGISALLLKISLKRQFNKIFFKEELNWKIGIVKDNKKKLLDQPKKSFWADPFLTTYKDGYALFFEELSKKDGLGKISCAVLNSDLEIMEKRMVIDEDNHFSFPNIFQTANTYYMVPESTGGYNGLRLYECKKFPFEWTFKKNLMDGIKLLDPIWIYHNNLYWIFGNKLENFEHDNNEKLYLYYSKDLFSSKGWKPHKQNPIVADATKARNAGNIFYKNDKLYRVSQKCFNGYGENLVVNEIMALSTDRYAEKTVKEIFPPKHYIGMHTMNIFEDVKVYDYLIAEK